MVFAHVGGSLDLRGANLADLNLSGASIAGDLVLGGSYKPAVWKGKNGEPRTLTLRNAHVGNLVDVENAWPAPGHLYLDGFTFGHLGGFEGETGAEMRARQMRWWDDWARLDPNYSPAPYAQLAAALISAGDRDAANEIRYLGRERERETAWSQHNWGAWLWWSVLNYGFGYGIGLRSFRVLVWVLIFSAIGAAILWRTVPTTRSHARGTLWCFGASLARLLPVIEISKEFKDFFDNPEREGLTRLPRFVFAGLAILGWVLGAILVAAVAGLTQGP